MWPFTPAWKSNDYQTAHNAVEKTADQKLLHKIAAKAPLISIRYAALTKITTPDQEFLKQIVMKDIDKNVRAAAVEKLDDQKTLGQAAIHDPSQYVRLEAVGKITDQQTLTEVFNSGSDARWSALERITDQNVLLALAENAPDAYGRVRAAEKLEGRTDLKIRIFQEAFAEEDYNYPKLPSSRIVKLLLEHGALSQEALQRLVATGGPDMEFFDVFAEKIADPRVFESIVVHKGRFYPNVFKKTPCYHDEIATAISGLEDSDRTMREKAAARLLELFRDNPKAAKLLWSYVHGIVRQRHTDRSYADNGHEDGRDHTDTGFGSAISFPPYPFEE